MDFTTRLQKNSKIGTGVPQEKPITQDEDIDGTQSSKEGKFTFFYKIIILSIL